MYSDLLWLQENLTVSCQVHKWGATTTSHVNSTRFNVLHINALDGKWEYYMTVFQILKNYILFTFVFSRRLSYLFARHTFDQQVVACEVDRCCFLNFFYFYFFSFGLFFSDGFAFKFELLFRYSLFFFTFMLLSKLLKLVLETTEQHVRKNVADCCYVISELEVALV